MANLEAAERVQDTLVAAGAHIPGITESHILTDKEWHPLPDDLYVTVELNTAVAPEPLATAQNLRFILDYHGMYAPGCNSLPPSERRWLAPVFFRYAMVGYEAQLFHDTHRIAERLQHLGLFTYGPVICQNRLYPLTVEPVAWNPPDITREFKQEKRAQQRLDDERRRSEWALSRVSA